MTLTSSVVYYQLFTTVELQCVATGTPQPEISWTKDGQSLSISTASSNVFFYTSNTRLVITAAGSSDAGLYQCRAFNAWGTAVSNVSRLALASQGAFPQAPPAAYPVQEGQGLSVPCVGAPVSVPNATYSWSTTLLTLPGGKQTPLTLSDRIQINDKGSLYFANVQSSDAKKGRYLACSQSNAFLGSTRTGSYSQLNVKTGKTPAYFQLYRSNLC
jgi:hypothetical protein